MNAIVAVDNRWAIGYKGSLLVRIPMDQKFFRDTTMGKVVVLGRKTLETFPNGLPLKGRTNIVLSRNPDLNIKDTLVVHSKEELLEELRQYPTEDIFIIGGSSVYDMMLPYCNTVHVTKIDYVYQADSYFPNLDNHPDWVITGESDENTYFDVEFTFYRYENKHPVSLDSENNDN
jgi:dihydrofolate reductase